MYVDGERGSAPCGCPQKKLEPTDVILSSYAKMEFFCTRIVLITEAI